MTQAPAACLPPAVQLPIRLMIVDDSVVARAVLSRMISSQADFELVAEAASSEEALELLDRSVVDIVLLDVEMPGASGLEALPEILRRGKGARVLIVSSLLDDDPAAVAGALALGAAEVLPKPRSNGLDGNFSELLAARLRGLGRRDRGPESVAPTMIPGLEPAIRLRPRPEAALRCLALAASTGGLHALTAFLQALPPRIGAPILVTQHLPAAFLPFFSRQIEAASKRLTHIAAEGLDLAADQIVLAPGDAHLGLERHGAKVTARLLHEAVANGSLPSADPMLAAVADVFGRNGLGILFSGMGRDGLAGGRRLVEAGGAMLAQDRASSAVWGMPRAIAEAGLTSAVMSPADLAGLVARQALVPSWR